MNIDKVFEFIKEKRGYSVPFEYKLIEGLPMTEDDLKIKGDLFLALFVIKSLPDNLTVGGDLNLYRSEIKELPNNLVVYGDLSIRHTDIKTLPDNLTVGGDLYINDTNITSLPDNLHVGGDLFLANIPLSMKYRYQEIRKMIEEKGGYVGGKIST
jgi:hypothetical protein